MRFSRQEYWSGLPCPSLRDLPNPGINQPLLRLQHWQAGSLPLALLGKPSDLRKLYQFSSFHLLNCVQVFATPCTAARQASLSITNFQSLIKLMFIESVMPSNHFISVVSFFSCLQSFSAARSFPITQFFASGGQSIGVLASESALPTNIQD